MMYWLHDNKQVYLSSLQFSKPVELFIHGESAGISKFFDLSKILAFVYYDAYLVKAAKQANNNWALATVPNMGRFDMFVKIINHGYNMPPADVLNILNRGLALHRAKEISFTCADNADNTVDVWAKYAIDSDAQFRHLFPDAVC